MKTLSKFSEPSFSGIIEKLNTDMATIPIEILGFVANLVTNVKLSHYRFNDLNTLIHLEVLSSSKKQTPAIIMETKIDISLQFSGYSDIFLP